jgi:hypothetical protein
MRFLIFLMVIGQVAFVAGCSANTEKSAESTSANNSDCEIGENQITMQNTLARENLMNMHEVQRRVNDLAKTSEQLQPQAIEQAIAGYNERFDGYEKKHLQAREAVGPLIRKYVNECTDQKRVERFRVYTEKQHNEFMEMFEKL